MSQNNNTSGNAFDQLFASNQGNQTTVNSSTPQHVKKSTGQQVENVAPKKTKEKSAEKPTQKKVNNSKSQTVNTLTSKQINTSSSGQPTSKRRLKDGKQTKAKTFFLEPEIIEMFKYIKFKKKIDESKYANMVLDQIFTQEFGEKWRKLVG